MRGACSIGRPPGSPRKARPGRATGADLLSNFAGLRVRSAQSGTARPAFVKTRYSGLTGHDDGQHGDDAGLAAGEQEGGWRPAGLPSRGRQGRGRCRAASRGAPMYGRRVWCSRPQVLVFERQGRGRASFCFAGTGGPIATWRCRASVARESAYSIGRRPRRARAPRGFGLRLALWHARAGRRFAARRLRRLDGFPSSRSLVGSRAVVRCGGGIG